jgi:Holliday junction DNA helicase RuvB
MDREGCGLLGRVGRGTPRVVNNLVRWVRDFAHNEKTTKANVDMVRAALALKGIEDDGMDATDLRILRTLVETFNGGPVGVESLASAAGEDSVTLEENHEPYLLSQGYWQRTPKGRVATSRAWERLGKTQKGVADQPALL